MRLEYNRARPHCTVSRAVVLKLCATAHQCAEELFGIFENHQFVLQLRMQASMRGLNAHYPLDKLIVAWYFPIALQM